MPDHSIYADIIRGNDFRFKGYLATLPYTVVLRTAFDPSGAVTYPLLELEYSDLNGDGYGDYTEIFQGMLVKVYDGTTTRVKGILRVAVGGITSTIIPVNEFSQIEIDIVSGDAIEVIDVYQIKDKLVAANDAFNKDSRLTYIAQGEDPPPVANGGGVWFGHVDPGQDYATVVLDASTSFTVDPDTSSLSYIWFNEDCTITLGDNNTSSITIQVPVGFRHVRLNVIDTTNGNGMYKNIPIYVFDRGVNQPLHVLMNRRRSTKRTGWTIEFELPADEEAALDTFPDGCLVVYWEDEYRDGRRQSYGSALENRSHIKFVGYLVRDEISIDFTGNTVRFEAVSPLQILEQTPALNQLLVNDATPTDWTQIKTLSINRAYWYLAYWHSTFMEYFDFIWSPTGEHGNNTYPRLAVSDIDNLAAQLRDIADAVNHEVTCDALGRLLFTRKLNYQPLSDRDDKITTWEFWQRDILRLIIPREHRGRVKYVLALGLTAAGADLQAQSGSAPAGYGTASETLDRQIVTSITDLEQRAAWHLAALNGLYYGLYVPQDVTIELPDEFDVFDPAYNEWLTIILPDTTNARRVSFTEDDRWILEEVEVVYDNDLRSKSVTIVVDHETYAENAVEVP